MVRAVPAGTGVTFPAGQELIPGSPSLSRAIKNGKGLHSKKEVPIHRVADISGVRIRSGMWEWRGFQGIQRGQTPAGTRTAHWGDFPFFPWINKLEMPHGLGTPWPIPERGGNPGFPGPAEGIWGAPALPAELVHFSSVNISKDFYGALWCWDGERGSREGELWDAPLLWDEGNGARSVLLLPLPHGMEFGVDLGFWDVFWMDLEMALGMNFGCVSGYI